mmetsp:Transcript_1076/g.2965  ORF Transcript_1076/g.2965 Transcript_1076/m.2965 type:complete len:431 (+) Transcript_1076:2737-4029(+)
MARGKVLRRHAQRSEELLDRVGVELAHAREGGHLHHAVACAEGLEHDAVGVARGEDANRLHDAPALELLEDHLVVHGVRLLFRVGLDAAHKVHLTGCEHAHEALELGLELGRHALEDEALHHARALGRGLLLRGRRKERRHERLGGCAQEHRQVLGEGVLVLEEEALGRVGHRAGEVAHGEGALGVGARVARVVDEALVLAHEPALELGHKGLVGALGEDALLVEHGDESHAVGGEELEHVAVVHLRLVEGGHGDALGLGLGHGRGEDHAVEEALKLLVGVVDEQLLERVVGEELKPKDVEDADEGVRLRVRVVGAASEADGLVDGQAHAVKDARVEGLGQRVHEVHGLGGRVWLGDPLCARADAPRGERLTELGHVHAQQAREGLQGLERPLVERRAHGRLARPGRGEVHVAAVQHRGEHGQRRPHLRA